MSEHDEKLFTNGAGYAPLLANLEGYWEKSLDELPDHLRRLVNRAFRAHPWDGLNVANRRNIAAQLDYQHDPNHEPATYFELVVFTEELKGWIDRMRRESKDAAVVVLRDVADRLEKILDADRERVGAEIQALREVAQTEPSVAMPNRSAQTKEKRTLLTIIASLCKHAGIDCEQRGAAQRLRQLTEKLGAPLDDGTIARVLEQLPDALAARMK